MDRANQLSNTEPTPTSDLDSGRDAAGERTDGNEANPPRTTTGKMTSPKFGSAGSVAELEPGPERD